MSWSSNVGRGGPLLVARWSSRRRQVSLAADPEHALIQGGASAAGEFASAAALAQQAAHPANATPGWPRSPWPQAQAGARDASLQSAAASGDDLRRPRRSRNVAAVPSGGQGGGDAADRDSLMELITLTVSLQTWDAVGGEGTMYELPSGVLVHARGMLKPLLKEEESAGKLAAQLAASGRAGAEKMSVATRRCAWSGSRGGKADPVAPGRWPATERGMQVLGRAGDTPTRLRSIWNRATWCWLDRPATGRPAKRTDRQH